MAVAVRPAQKADVREMAAVLARAFYDDPVMTWMLPDDAQRAKGLPRTYAAMTRHHFIAGGGAEVATNGTNIVAATLWDPPGRWQHSRRDGLVMMPSFLWAFRLRVRTAQQVGELMKLNHPEGPHWYLMVIGSDPSVRGTGFGQALMHSRLDRCDSEGVPAYLENSNPKNESYYLRFGFEVMGEIKLPDGGPGIWPMWRSPR